MSNVTLFGSGQVPAFAKKGELSAIAKALSGGSGASSGKRVSIKGGVFRLLVNGQQVAAIEDRFLDVVIVRAAPNIGRTFYAKAYDPEAATGPDCWSADGEKPDKSSSSPQSTACVTCDQNKGGSGQGSSRACKYSQRLAVTLANDISGDVLQLQLPAMSIFGKEEGENRPLQAYARYLVAQGYGPETLVTRMRFDTKAESPKLYFKPMRWLTEEEYAEAQRQGDTEDAKRAVTMTVAAVDKVAAPIKLDGAPPRAAKPEAAPVAVEDDEEEEAKPIVRKNKAEEPAPAVKASLAKLAAEWDDE